MAAGNLKRLMHPRLHVDEFKSKMGNDEDIITLSFKITGKEPATDLSDFIEKGHDWVLDADVSAGEMDDGDYIVFVEIERRLQVPNYIIDLITDINNLTDHKMKEWKFRYYRNNEYRALTKENLQKTIPLTRHAYRKIAGLDEINEMRVAAGLRVNIKATKNAHTDAIRIAAGIL